MDMPERGNAAGYVLGSGGTERQRLVRQARVFAAEASWLLDQVGAKPGWRAVDVGCGPIGIMDLLSDRVGTAGETVGVDNEARMIAMARDVAAELDLTNLTLVEAEATGTGLEHASFDFAHARLLLVNVPDPERVVAELAALVRPGGVVALQELDWVSWICQPPHPAWDRLRDALRDFRARRGHRTLLVTFARLHGAALVADGLVAADELGTLVAELEAHLADPATITFCCLFCQAWAVKPAREPHRLR
jgi:SAM-dependent methyltransferase